MPAFSRKFLVGGIVTLLVMLIAGLLVLLWTVLPFRHQRAREHWQQQHIQHYEVDINWANGWNFGHARIEMRNNTFVRGIDLDTGQPLSPSKVLFASYFSSINNLFDIIDVRIRPAWNWRNLLAKYAPTIAHRIDPCVAPLSDVRYDPQYGYPSEIWFNDSWCANTFFNYSHVHIERFTPLP